MASMLSLSRMPGPERGRVLLVTVPMVLAAVVVRADEVPTLHEYVPDLASDAGTLLVSSGGAEPDAIVYRGELLPAPEATGAIGPEERPMRAASGESPHREEPGRRSPSFRPDRVTELEGTVGYYTVFTPTIAPFKRVTGLERVTLAADGTPVLSIPEGTRRPVDVEGVHSMAPDDRPRDRFWGSVVLDFSEGRTVPLPGVSPESRVLTLRSEPPTPIRLERDAADNLYATAVGPAAETVRAIFLMDAPRSYFGRPLPAGPVGALADRVHPLPPAVQRDAEAFAAELGLSTESELDVALRTLARHFRSFEESREPPTDTGNIYLDLARGRRGICRHRAYGFVITAQALGIPARFVQNEAHAWAEVALPGDGGWLRVDLGGAATGLEARGAGDRPRYEPEKVDPLPRPEEYERAYEEAARATAAREAVFPSEGSAVPGRSPAAERARGPEAVGGEVHAALALDTRRRAHLDLSLDRERFEVFRGREIEVTGGARGGGRGVEGLRVEILLRARTEESERLLGVTVTNAQGRFRAVVGVPPEVAVGAYDLVVQTPGNDSFEPAQAR